MKAARDLYIVPGDPSPDLVSVRVPIHGMTCQSCVRSIEGSVRELPGIHYVKVELSEKAGYFKYDPSACSADSIRSHIEDMGFEVTDNSDGETRNLLNPEIPTDTLIDMSTDASLLLAVVGMTCQSCVDSIQGALKDVPGVTSSTVSLAQGTALVTFTPAEVTPDLIKDTIYNLGFDVDIISVTDKVESLRPALANQHHNEQKNNKNVLYSPEAENKDQGGSGDRRARAGGGEATAKTNGNAPSEISRCTLEVKGMTCASCVAAIEKHCAKLTGKAGFGSASSG
ncbi:copper-transporting ATPase 1, partial [Danaus plexippus plexippus]